MTDWARRFLAWPHALTATGVLLAVAALAQAVAGTGASVLYVLPVCLLALGATVPLIFLPPLAAAIAITTASVLSLAAFGLVTVNGVAPGWVTAGGAVAQVIAVYRLGTVRAGRFPALLTGLPFLVLALAGRGGTSGILLASAVPMAAGAGIAVRSGQVASRSDTARTALAESLVENMAQGERARIARELHDVVAHHISMISVQAETARLTTPGLDDAGAERFREIGDTARAGLTEMRRLLGVLRPDATASDADPGSGPGPVPSPASRQPQPGLPQITSLIDAARISGVPGVSGGRVRLIVSGAVRSYEPGVELAAYRIVQEALTNARRHAPGAAVDVELTYDEVMLRLRVRDNGPGPGASGVTGNRQSGPAGSGHSGHGHSGDGHSGGGGHGLLGMRERAATVGGTLRTGEAPGGGFLVEARLPAQGHDRETV